MNRQRDPKPRPLTRTLVGAAVAGLVRVVLDWITGHLIP